MRQRGRWEGEQRPGELDLNTSFFISEMPGLGQTTSLPLVLCSSKMGMDSFQCWWLVMCRESQDAMPASHHLLSTYYVPEAGCKRTFVLTRTLGRGRRQPRCAYWVTESGSHWQNQDSEPAPSLQQPLWLLGGLSPRAHSLWAWT